MKFFVFVVTLFLTISTSAFSTSIEIRRVAFCTTSDYVYAVEIYAPSETPLLDNYMVIRYARDVDGRPITNRKVIKITPADPQRNRLTYIDTSTYGKLFRLEGPSFVYPRYSLRAQVRLSGSYQMLSYDYMSCSVFDGKSVNF